MATTPVVMDGITYHVRIRTDPPMEESFRIADGPNAGTSLAGTDIRDIIGTYYDHTLTVEPDPAYLSDYNSFFLAISAPVESHTITLPHGSGTITYQAKILSGSHQYRRMIGGKRYWTGLKVYAQAIKPQREAEGIANLYSFDGSSYSNNSIESSSEYRTVPLVSTDLEVDTMTTSVYEGS